MKATHGALLLFPPMAVFGIWFLMQNELPILVPTTAVVQIEGANEKVENVVDGDTFDTFNGRIRIWGIDAPELKQKCYSASSFWLCGKFSSSNLTKMILGKELVCNKLSTDRDDAV